MNKSNTGSILNTLGEFSLSKKASIISGIVCAIPFVFSKSFLLSFVAYVPFFILFFQPEKLKEKGKWLYNRVFLFGFFFFVVGYVWLAELYPLDYAGFTDFESFGIIFLALTIIPAIHSGLLTLCFVFCRMCTKKSGDFFKILVFPCIIVFSEYLQTLGALAFPWCRMCIAQSDFLPFLQSASLFGSYFITYLVLLINALLGYAVINRAFAKKAVIAAAALFLANTLFGAVRLVTFDRQTERFTAVALQGNYSSSAKWSGGVSDMVTDYIQLSEKGLEEVKREGMSENIVVLMPETALPVIINDQSRFSDRLSAHANKNDIIFAVGALTYTENSVGNSVFFYDQKGKMSAPYMKRILVPFGEYLPYRDLFSLLVPSINDINMLSTDLTPGTDTCVYDCGFAKLGTIICYESIFPEICRSSVKDGANVLLIATNDSWFGSSGALRHHLAAARMRAIENNVPIVRAANTGITAHINPDGTIARRIDINTKDYLAGELYLGTGKTLYTYIGDVILPLCLAMCLLGFAGRLYGRIKETVCKRRQEK